jgi:hypothetical protein
MILPVLFTRTNFKEQTNRMEAEKTICEVSPSQILNLRAYVFSMIASAAIIAIAILTHTPSLAFLLALPLLYAVGNGFKSILQSLRSPTNALFSGKAS